LPAKTNYRRLHAKIARVNILDDQALFVLTLETALHYVRLAIHGPSRRTGAASIEDSEVIEKILKHLGLYCEPRRALRPRAPPVPRQLFE
jgi:hypothetical protein